MADRAASGTAELRDAAVYCLAQLRRHDPDRLATVGFAPPSARAALLALYAFEAGIMRLRDTVRDPLLREIRLQWWREAMAELGEGRARTTPELRLLQEPIARGRLAVADLERLIDAWSRDFDSAPGSLADLEARGRDTSGRVLEAALGVLGVRQPSACEAARHVGTAWALSALIRAVPFDARRGRCRLPPEVLQRHGLTAAAVATGARGTGLAAAIAALDQRVGEHLHAARSLARAVAREALPALLLGVLAEMHRRRLATAGFDPYAPASPLAPLTRQLRLARCAWRGHY